MVRDLPVAAKRMIERTEERFALKPKRLAGNMTYGTGRFLGWLTDRGIEPHIPVWDRSKRKDGALTRTDFS